MGSGQRIGPVAKYRGGVMINTNEKMSTSEKISMFLNIAMSLFFTYIILEELNPTQWRSLKRTINKKYQDVLDFIHGGPQRRREIEIIARSMGYEPEWIDRLFE